MDFQKLGSFYLGKGYDLKKGKLLDQLVKQVSSEDRS